MSTVINIKTMQYLKSVHTPDYPTADYTINPVLPKCDKKYWKIKDNKVVEMTKTEKAVVDNKLVEKAEALGKTNIREGLIQKRMHKIAEDELIGEGIIEKKLYPKKQN